MGLFDANAVASGEMWFDGSRVAPGDLGSLRGHGISLVPQGVSSLDPLMRVGEQVRGEARGADRRARREDARRRMVRQRELFEAYGLASEVERMMRVGEQVRGEARGADRRARREDARRRMVRQRELFEAYGLASEVERMYPHELSGGMARRVLLIDPVRRGGEQVRGEARGADRRARREETRRRMVRQRELFEADGLASEVERMYPHELSGGMARRVLLMCAPMEVPRLLIADEPTPGMDDESAAVAARDLRAFAHDGGGVLLITHDLDFALSIAMSRRRVWMMSPQPSPRAIFGPSPMTVVACCLSRMTSISR